MALDKYTAVYPEGLDTVEPEGWADQHADDTLLPHLPEGGLTGQHLAKRSNTTYDVLWVTPETGGGAPGGTGNVTGPASAATGRVAIYSDATGKVIADSGILNSDIIQRTGGTMTGQLALPGGAAGNQAISVNQVQTMIDAEVSDVVGPAGATADNIAVFDTATGKLIKDGGKPVSALLLKAGDTMGGPLVLPADPTVDTQAANKRYVDLKVTTDIAAAAPNDFVGSGPTAARGLVPSPGVTPSLPRRFLGEEGVFMINSPVRQLKRDYKAVQNGRDANGNSNITDPVNDSPAINAAIADLNTGSYRWLEITEGIAALSVQPPRIMADNCGIVGYGMRTCGLRYSKSDLAGFATTAGLAQMLVIGDLTRNVSRPYFTGLNLVFDNWDSLFSNVGTNCAAIYAEGCAGGTFRDLYFENAIGAFEAGSQTPAAASGADTLGQCNNLVVERLLGTIRMSLNGFLYRFNETHGGSYVNIGVGAVGGTKVRSWSLPDTGTTSFAVNDYILDQENATYWKCILAHTITPTEPQTNFDDWHLAHPGNWTAAPEFNFTPVICKPRLNATCDSNSFTKLVVNAPFDPIRDIMVMDSAGGGFGNTLFQDCVLDHAFRYAIDMHVPAGAQGGLGNNEFWGCRATSAAAVGGHSSSTFPAVRIWNETTAGADARSITCWWNGGQFNAWNGPCLEYRGVLGVSNMSLQASGTKWADRRGAVKEVAIRFNVGGLAINGGSLIPSQLGDPMRFDKLAKFIGNEVDETLFPLSSLRITNVDMGLCKLRQCIDLDLVAPGGAKNLILANNIYSYYKVLPWQKKFTDAGPHVLQVWDIEDEIMGWIEAIVLFQQPNSASRKVIRLKAVVSRDAGAAPILTYEGSGPISTGTATVSAAFVVVVNTIELQCTNVAGAGYWRGDGAYMAIPGSVLEGPTE